MSEYFNDKYSSIDEFRATAEKVIEIKIMKRRKTNMTLDELWSNFDSDLKQIEEECEREGYPSRGSNFDLRYDELFKRYHDYEKYCVDYIDEEEE